MALQPVDVDVQPSFGGGVRQLHQLLHGARPDQRAVGLEERPEGEDADVVETEGGEGVEVGADRVRIEVQPVMEPPLSGGVVGAEAQRAAGGVLARAWAFLSVRATFGRRAVGGAGGGAGAQVSP